MVVVLGKSSPGRPLMLPAPLSLLFGGFSGLTIGSCVCTLFKPCLAVCKGGCGDTGPSEILCKEGERVAIEK